MSRTDHLSAAAAAARQPLAPEVLADPYEPPSAQPLGRVLGASRLPLAGRARPSTTAELTGELDSLPSGVREVDPVADAVAGLCFLALFAGLVCLALFAAIKAALNNI